MKKLKSCFLSALGLFALTTLSAHGQGTTLFIPSSSVNLTIGPYQDQAHFTFSTPSISLANYGAVAATFSAPSGYAWRFDPALASGLECYIAFGAQPARNGTVAVPCSFNFVPGMEGIVTWPARDQTDWAWDSETGFGFDLRPSFDRAVEFTDCTVTMAYGVTQDEYNRQAPLDHFSLAYLNGSSGNLNGGLTLVLIPEPSVAALAVLAAVVFYRRCRALPCKPAIYSSSGQSIRNRPEV